ncbi:MAG: tripartite tricarboxylate transporter substrate binding protein, partial [Rhodobacteraceae bacterium]|nr:tripartite tricarboxylate transporter substrate binding protein [Paracoccaceae bacterium]
MKKIIGTAALCAAVMAGGSAFAFECKRGEASFDKPGGFP